MARLEYRLSVLDLLDNDLDEPSGGVVLDCRAELDPLNCLPKFSGGTQFLMFANRHAAHDYSLD